MSAHGTTCHNCGAANGSAQLACPLCGEKPPKACTRARHEFLRVNPVLWRLHTTPVKGLQDDGAGGWLQLANCNACGSTISREVEHGEGLPVSFQVG